ncbi:hypothetical protein C3L33_13303, partial [Rhododendron williamsianum]
MPSLHWKTTALALTLFQLLHSIKVESFLSQPDRINQLPGQPQVNFQQFSGYVTVDEKKTRALFYYFVEAEGDPDSKPLLKTDALLYFQTGHYIPQLAELMIQFNKKEKLFNLKGIAVSSPLQKYPLGNPVLEFATDFNSRAEYFWSHGLISDPAYKLFTSTSSYRGDGGCVCGRRNCKLLKQARRAKCSPCAPCRSQQMACLQQVIVFHEHHNELVLSETVLFLIAIHCLLTFCVSSCFNPWIAVSWIMSCSTWRYQQSLLWEKSPRQESQSWFTDSVIPLTGTRTLVQGLAQELGLKTSVPYRVWFAGMQVGGWTQVYGDILSFATIRGASHEAPFSQPERSLVLFQAFIEGRPLPEAF